MEVSLVETSNSRLPKAGTFLHFTVSLPQILDILAQVVQFRNLHLLLNLQRVRFPPRAIQCLHDHLVDHCDELLVVFKALLRSSDFAAVVANRGAYGAEAAQQVSDPGLLCDQIFAKTYRLLGLEVELNITVLLQ